ncbi:MAG: tetratricopeptide repeat protein, partial [Dongiaceae bacterium]
MTSMRKSLLPLAALLLGLLPSLARADYAAGLHAYDTGNFAAALEQWLPLAKAGDAKAQHGVALLYETGRGVPAKDDVEAAKWYAAAAIQGIAESQANLALMFAEGRGVDQDYARAADLWRQAAENGNTVAHYNLGLLYLNGYGVDKDEERAAGWFEKAAELKVVDAQYAIARLYRDGTGVPKDLAKARYWYDQAALGGHSLAAAELAALAAAEPETAPTPPAAAETPTAEPPQTTHAAEGQAPESPTPTT